MNFPTAKHLRWIILVLVALVLLIVFPPFRIVRVETNENSSRTIAKPEAAFDPVTFAQSFWQERLLPTAETTTDLTAVLEALSESPESAAERYGHRSGIGGPAYFFVRGEGRVVAGEGSSLLVSVGGNTVSLRTGPVFGNVVRDGTGLLEVNSVPGLAEFNAISAELNRLVEERVQPKLRDLAPGTRLHFAGCAKAPESTGGEPALAIIPVMVELLP